MTLRDEIAEIIQTIDEPWLAADDIMTTVREALLSDEAVASGEQKWHEIQDDGVNYEGDDERFRASITAALDAITTD